MYRSYSQRFAHSRLNTSKVTNLLNEYLDDFETKLKWNRFDQVDMQVPRLIIAKFKMLLKMWKDNETISKYLKRELFEDIYTLMTDVLDKYDFRRTIDNDSSQTDSHMDTDCENYNVNMLGNILDHSYALQITSFGKFNSMLMENTNVETGRQRIDLTNRMINDKDNFFRCFLCRISIPIDDEKKGTGCLDDVISSHEQDDDHRFNSLVFQSHQCFVKVHNLEEDSFQCTLCGGIFHLHLLMEHFANSKHTFRKIISTCKPNLQSITSTCVNTNSTQIEFIVQIINDKGIFTKCHLCRMSIPVAPSACTSKSLRSYLDDIVQAHERNEIHKFNLLVFYTHQPYIEINNEKENTYSCTLCDKIIPLDSLMNHFTNSDHTKLKLLSMCNVDVENFNELRINFIIQTSTDEGNTTKCHLCRTTICADSSNTDTDEVTSVIDGTAAAIEAHQRGINHRFNFLVYKSHERFIKVINQDRNFFQCHLCGEVFFLGSLMDHFTDFKHTKLKLLSTCGTYV